MVPAGSTDEDKSATIKIEDTIVTGTEYFIMPKNKGINDKPAQAIAITIRWMAYSPSRAAGNTTGVNEYIPLKMEKL